MANQNFKNFLEEKDYAELKSLWNECASENGYEQIYDSVEEFAANFETEGAELARMVFFGDVKNWGDNVYVNGYGNFESCWSINSSPIDLDVLADWLEEENHDIYTEWKEGLQTFDDWLNDSYSRSDLIAMWEEYTGDDVEGFDLGALAESIEEADGDEYLAYVKEVLE